MGKVIRFLECVKMAIEELRQQPPPVIPSEKSSVPRRKLEAYRTFNTQPKATDVYEKGLVLPEEQSRPGNLLDPIHKYCVIDESSSKELATEAVRFAAACLNERVNGTIHFGVVGKWDCIEEMQAGEILGMHIDKKQCDVAVTDEIYRSFFPDQIDVAHSCIREPVYIPVIEKDAAGVTLFVVEVDVIPHSEVVAETAFFLKPHQGESVLLFRYIQGHAVSVEGEDLLKFMDFKKKTLRAAQRK